ncbi:hypothetical protein G6F46_007341 [Rhizopus delemar]|uniref:Uncharacterized protein n=2 Tax=Rhizopus TaxID=4842 RepID=A0A9P6Z175_9FUNG|nr:hypothetical protein G6F55_010055 [Rhizopus delemar]KAG1542093.1 hypothetical protein G6F51_007490 [Rhizopus arrhizus]KAG1509905.1 hypothetical protein G6F53_007086 [Rhizopus delemar]KAG1518439.1 hypothetical protein G6F52_009021 [Rhizopus delemar]KAG1568604.1 hypothetical protein G6F50_007137 [Rhizopus delemar]
MPTLPPFLSFRAGVAIGSKFFMPFLSESPYCYIFDLNKEEWSTEKLSMANPDEFHLQVTSAAAIGNKIYLVGGRLLKSYTLSNTLIEIDTQTFNVQVINDAVGTPPRPRHEHSVDAIADRYLVVFGGLCYNSVGENDVFVYDTIKNCWFVPHISGQIPHLRFGHATAVVGKNLYVHGGAQIDSDSSYIIYDDLYKLDYQTWTWYKYEHPEVERYLRNQAQRESASLEREYLIPTTGDSPHDRFQCCMCAISGKLITFGGHSIRMDKDDSEILCNYSLDELSIFNIKRQLWSSINAELLEKDSEEFMSVSNMCVAVLPMDSRNVKIFVFAGKQLLESERRPSVLYSNRYSSDSSGEALRSERQQPLDSIMERDSKFAEDGFLKDDSDNSDDCEGMEEHSKIKKSPLGELRGPDDSEHSEHVKDAFRLIDPDVQGEPNSISQIDGESSNHNPTKRPSLKPLHGGGYIDTSIDGGQGKTSGSSNSSYEGYILSKVRKQNRITPCIIVIELLV